MADSVLCQLVRTSILEVLQAQNLLEKQKILDTYPLLNQIIPVKIELFLDEELRGSYQQQDLPLYDALELGAKKAAFEDTSTSPLTTREYLHIEVQITLQTPEGILTHKDNPILGSVD